MKILLHFRQKLICIMSICTICTKTFPNGKNLKRHTRMCLEKASLPAPKGLKCETCGALFTQRSSLHRHYFKSTKCDGSSKSKECQICKRKFTRHEHWVSHQSTLSHLEKVFIKNCFE